MARLWLHIGHGKTGTTAIQTAMRHRAVARGDLFYPGRGQVPNGAHHLLFPLTDDPWGPAVIDPLRALSDSLDRICGGRPVLLSSEHMCYLRGHQVAEVGRLMAGHDVRVIYYIRRQDTLLESMVRQKRVEGAGIVADPDALLADTDSALDFSRRVAPWEAAFGADRLRLRLYHPQTCAGDVVSDFEAAMGLPPSVGAAAGARAERVNPSLSPVMTEVLRLFDRLYPDAALRGTFVEGLKTLSDTGDAPLLSDDLRRKVMVRHAESNARVARRFLDEAEAALLCAP